MWHPLVSNYNCYLYFDRMIIWRAFVGGSQSELIEKTRRKGIEECHKRNRVRNGNSVERKKHFVFLRESNAECGRQLLIFSKSFIEK